MRTVQDVLDQYKLAVYNQDINLFMDLYDDSIHIFDSWNSWEIKSKLDWNKVIENWFSGLRRDGSTLKVSFEDYAIHEDDSVAFIHTSIRFSEFNSHNIEFRHLTNRFTFGLIKKNDDWKIIHEHSSLPIDSDQGTGLFNLK